MRILSVFRKSMREQLRSKWVLLLSISMAPIFVVVYWTFFSGGSTSYMVLVLNQDVGVPVTDGSTQFHGEGVVAAMEALTYTDGQGILRVRRVTSVSEAEVLLKDRQAATFFTIPEDFSENLHASEMSPYHVVTSRIVFSGDLVNPQYIVGSLLASSAIEEYVNEVTGVPKPLEWVETPLGSSGVRNEFDLYIPALSVVSVVMMIFQSSMTVTSEVEQGTLRRLKLTRVTSFDLLGGITLTQILISVASVSLTFATAYLLGFRSTGPLWLAVLIGIATSVAVMGVGLIIACFSRRVSDAFIYANFPLIFLMFFSGAMFPVPEIPLFTFMGITVNLFDWLPPTHAVVALNKVLTLGCTLNEVTFELTALTLLSAVYFVIGVTLFNRTHLQPD